MMMLLAVLLLAAATVLTIVVVTQGGDTAAFEVLGRDVDTTVWGVFLAGVVTGLIVLAGIAALGVGVRRWQSRRKEVKDLRQRVAQQEDTEPYAGTDGSASAEPEDNRPDHGRGRPRPADMS